MAAATLHYLQELVRGKLSLEHDYTRPADAREPGQVRQNALDFAVESGPFREGDVPFCADLEEQVL
jgi:hypothetical protein